jgi:hypothetical protein
MSEFGTVVAVVNLATPHKVHPGILVTLTCLSFVTAAHPLAFVLTMASIAYRAQTFDLR